MIRYPQYLLRLQVSHILSVVLDFVKLFCEKITKNIDYFYFRLKIKALYFNNMASMYLQSLEYF